MVGDRSEALPFDARPANLDGSLPGDVGFDPAGFTNNPPKQWLVGGEERSLKWCVQSYRTSLPSHICHIYFIVVLCPTAPAF